MVKLLGNSGPNPVPKRRSPNKKSLIKTDLRPEFS